MKKQYTIIILLLIWTTVMIVKPILESLPNQAQKEYETYMREMFEESRTVEAQFDDVVTYCKGHEEDLMKVSEIFWEQYYEDITPQETAEIAQNNTSPEWMELSKKLTLEYSIKYTGKCVYYFYTGGGSKIYVVYFDTDDNGVYAFEKGSYFCYKKEKINDNLYVGIFQNQMLGI